MFGQPLHFAVMGPSGSGKTTAVNAVKENFPGLGLQKQVNYTTRRMRKDEIAAGESDYVHTTVEHYHAMKENNDYIGFRETEGLDEQGNPEIQNYGGTAPHVNKIVFITDPGGLDMLKERSEKNGERIVSLFIDVPKEICHERMMLERNEEAANKRTSQYETFLPGKEKCDYIIDGARPLPEVVAELYDILQTEIMSHAYPY